MNRFEITLDGDPPCSPPYNWPGPSPAGERGFVEFIDFGPGAESVKPSVLPKGGFYPKSFSLWGYYDIGIYQAVVEPRGRYVKKKKAKGRLTLLSADFVFVPDYACQYRFVDVPWTAKRK